MYLLFSRAFAGHYSIAQSLSLHPQWLVGAEKLTEKNKNNCTLSIYFVELWYMQLNYRLLCRSTYYCGVIFMRISYSDSVCRYEIPWIFLFQTCKFDSLDWVPSFMNHQNCWQNGGVFIVLMYVTVNEHLYCSYSNAFENSKLWRSYISGHVNKNEF